MDEVHFPEKITRNLARGEQGVALIEFAISVSLLLIMFFGAIEVSRYILIVQKVEKTVDTITDLFTQNYTSCITSSKISDYLNATPLLMNPYSVGVNGVVYFTQVETDSAGDPPTVDWQVSGGGSLSATSKVSASGTNGSPASLASVPGGFTMNASEVVIIGEMFYNIQPIIPQDAIAIPQIYRVAVFKPRFVHGLVITPCT